MGRAVGVGAVGAGAIGLAPLLSLDGAEERGAATHLVRVRVGVRV